MEYMYAWALWGIPLIVAVSLFILSLFFLHKIAVRRIFAGVALACTAFSLVMTFLLPTFWWHMLLSVYSVSFLFFIGLCVFRTATAYTTAINAMAVGLVCLGVYSLYFIAPALLLWSVLFGSVILAIFGMLRLRVALMRYRLKNYQYKKTSLEDLPTVSVCVPARNETFALASCLDSILASDYPKLEVLVLDDCSQDNTSQLIKSFAHAGVRFIEGKPPTDGWLGRNQACDMLAKEASGSFLLYVDVDTRLSKTTISQLIDYALLKRISMLSVLPERRELWRASVLLAPLRYFWQMVVPQFIHTPAATALWLVRRKKLFEVGGFDEIKSEIMPENILARTFDLRGTYRYLLNGHQLGVFYAKKWTSQVETGMRLAYPTFEKRPYIVMLASLALYVFGIVPYLVLFFAAISQEWNAVVATSVAIVTVFSIMYLLYTVRVWRTGWFFTPLLLPMLLLQEIAIILASMVGYEFNKITWKGRNICYPVLYRPRKQQQR